MKKVNKHIIIVVIVSAVIIAAIILLYILLNKKNKEVDVVKIDNTQPNNDSTVLQYGSRGDSVKELQKFLNMQLSMLIWKQLPTYNGIEIKHLDEDGVFGNRTLSVVKWYFNSSTVNTNQFM